MEKEVLQSIYNTLYRYWREYYGTSVKIQSEIEETVRLYANTIPGDLYLILNQGSASGLFKHGHFLEDMERSLHILEKELGNSE